MGAGRAERGVNHCNTCTYEIGEALRAYESSYVYVADVGGWQIWRGTRETRSLTLDARRRAVAFAAPEFFDYSSPPQRNVLSMSEHPMLGIGV